MLALQSSAKIDPKSIVGVWLFDEGKGDVAKDSAKNGLEGNIIGGPKWVEGKFGKALEFDGVDDRVEVIHTPLLEINDKITIVVWVKGSPQASYPRILGKRTGAAGLEIQVHPNVATIAIRIDTTGGVNQLKTMEILDGQWRHVAYVLDKGNAKGYKDGVKATDSGYSHGNGFSSQDNLLIGAALPASLFFKGMLDDVAIFNAPLAEDDIANIMNKGLSETLNLETAVSLLGKLSTTWGLIKNNSNTLPFLINEVGRR
jgi:hypothetical protein